MWPLAARVRYSGTRGMILIEGKRILRERN
jgi:hypothetical protein